MVNLKYYLINKDSQFLNRKQSTVKWSSIHSLADKEFLHKSESTNAH